MNTRFLQKNKQTVTLRLQIPCHTTGNTSKGVSHRGYRDVGDVVGAMGASGGATNLQIIMSPDATPLHLLFSPCTTSFFLSSQSIDQQALSVPLLLQHLIFTRRPTPPRSDSSSGQLTQWHGQCTCRQRQRKDHCKSTQHAYYVGIRAQSVSPMSRIEGGVWIAVTNGAIIPLIGVVTVFFSTEPSHCTSWPDSLVSMWIGGRCRRGKGEHNWRRQQKKQGEMGRRKNVRGRWIRERSTNLWSCTSCLRGLQPSLTLLDAGERK